jgi:hypothetical protein
LIGLSAGSKTFSLHKKCVRLKQNHGFLFVIIFKCLSIIHDPANGSALFTSQFWRHARSLGNVHDVFSTPVVGWILLFI